MSGLDVLRILYTSSNLEEEINIDDFPRLITVVGYGDDHAIFMQGADNKFKVIATLIEYYNQATMVDEADFAGLPCDMLLTLNELSTDAVHDLKGLSKMRQLAFGLLIEFARDHSFARWEKLVGDVMRDLEEQRDIIKRKVDMINGIREYKLDEEDDFEIIAKPSASRVPKGDWEWTQAVINNKGPMVILNDLPANITYAQVMQGVTGVGGINSVLVKPEPAGSRKGTYCAAIHFNDSQAATAYIDFFKEKPLFFVDEDGDVHKTNMLYFKAANPSDHDAQSPVSGRCVDFANFPVAAVWAAISKIGLPGIVRVNFNPDASGDLGELSVEMTDVFKAEFIREVALSLPGVSGRVEDISYGTTESDDPPDRVHELYNNVIPYIEHGHLDEWNKAPYNTWEPPRTFHPDVFARMEYEATLPDIPEEDVRPIPEMKMGSRTYTAQDGCVYKHPTGSTFPPTEVRGKELKILQDMTLGKHEWADFWRELALQQQVLNPDIYANIVEHRRLKAEGRIICPPGCYDCGPSLRDSPVPLRAQMYTQGSDEGFMHGAWLQGDDQQIRMSIPPMTPQFLRYN
ncbi:hypothetical protein Neosp_001850 [[Neocosmospora] mangrovei]